MTIQHPIETPAVLDAVARKAILESVGKSPSDKLATLIIGFRLPENDPSRIKNMQFLLEWIDHFFGDLFDVLVVEQDSKARFDPEKHRPKPYVRYEFLYNPDAYNRGWGYNVAVKHFVTSDVVALMDTDVLIGANFVDNIVECFGNVDAISPYTNIYYSDADEAECIIRDFSLDGLNNPERIKNPTTISGGVIIMKRSVYLELCGFEQYIGYSCEDRAMDVTLINHCGLERMKLAPYSYVHLYHPSDQAGRRRFERIYAHLIENYACKYDPTLTPHDFIHKNCHHVSKEATLSNMFKRKPSFADKDLYSSERQLAINGCYSKLAGNYAAGSVIFPPETNTLEAAAAREFYNAPAPDTEELAALYNAYKGKRCFIIGNGPSLNKQDLSLLENEYTFAVNSFYYKTNETGFRPTFFVVEDTSVMKENLEQIRDYDAPFKFFPTLYKNLHPKTPNTFFFEMNRGFYEKSSPNYCVPRFSTDASKVLYCGQSVTYINLQLAFFMGFTEVYLIGMDFSYVIPDTHVRKGDVLTSTTDDPNHFHKDYFGKGKTWKDPKLDRVALSYRQAKLSFEAVGRKIYNATVGGQLEIFDRVNPYELLGAPDHPMAAEARIAADIRTAPMAEVEKIYVPIEVEPENITQKA